MARGWESKSVESQIEERKAMAPERRKRYTADEKEQIKQREALETQRRRLERELAATTSPVRRTALENGLKFLSDELKKLASKDH